MTSVHEWFEMTWADITNSEPVNIDATPIKSSPPWRDISLGIDWVSGRWRWHGWVCTKHGMRRICEMTRERALKASQQWQTV